ncbi:hypothetical protein GCM10010967_32770 [Dyadobacter beijingensis]|uniref:Secretion system C-terminal sorting domain-containing protein n=2 Tax=Dyadobacter beijingensis TaxID=365489 RepID=A0ABQ2HZZ4_9BACT|nr:hypothetical protein GCM10010967_32770 [Dyadobacter beijingensis]
MAAGCININLKLNPVMKKHLQLLAFALITLATQHLCAQGTHKVVWNGRELGIEASPQTGAGKRTAAYDIHGSITPNALRPESAIDIHLTFGPGTPIDAIAYFFFMIKPACASPFCNEESVAHAYVTAKMINKPARTLDFTMGGLLPGKDYSFVSYVFGLDGNWCSGSDALLAPFTTAPAPTPKAEKVLLVINQEYEGNARLNAELDRYENDIRRSNPLVNFERYHVPLNNASRARLYQDIQDRFRNDNLSTLFFIGGNASMTTTTEMLDANEQAAWIYSGEMFSYYAHPYYPTYYYDPVTDAFKKQMYQDPCLVRPNDARQPVFQQSNAALSMGMVLPDVLHSTDQQIDYIVSYFNKLHNFRLRQFTFEPKILATDGFVGEQGIIDLAVGSGNWLSGEALQYGRTKDPDYSGDDAVWKNDFTAKLSSNSYEIFTLTLHGAPQYHSFGIYGLDIQNLPSLNTRLIDLYSCSVGGYKAPGFLAGLYLGKGNVMNVHAFSQNIGLFSEPGKSGLERLYKSEGAYTFLAKGYPIGSAYRYFNGYNEAELILGDPLLTLRIPTALPVTVAQFEAYKNENRALLGWTTTEETNAERFEIEHGTNGKSWQQIGVTAAKGPGNRYEFSHDHPRAGTNLYRLKMVDNDGTFAYSKVVSVAFDKENTVAVFPNPAAGAFSIAWPASQQILLVRLKNGAGTTVQSFEKPAGNQIGLKGVRAGIYVVEIETASEKYTGKVVVAE